MVLELSFFYVFTREEVSTFVFIILSWCWREDSRIWSQMIQVFIGRIVYAEG